MRAGSLCPRLTSLHVTLPRLHAPPDRPGVPSATLRTNFRSASHWCRKRDSNPRPHHYEARIRGVRVVQDCSFQYAGMQRRSRSDRGADSSGSCPRLNSGERERTVMDHRNCNRRVTAALEWDGLARSIADAALQRNAATPDEKSNHFTRKMLQRPFQRGHLASAARHGTTWHSVARGTQSAGDRGLRQINSVT
jgi:hypothetical protein